MTPICSSPTCSHASAIESTGDKTFARSRCAGDAYNDALMGHISHKFCDLINLDRDGGWRRTAKRGNYRDFSVPIPVVCAPGGYSAAGAQSSVYPDMQQRVGSHRLPAAGIAGDGGRGHSRKALFNQVIIRQKISFACQPRRAK